jgi:putative peptidoglycan lipid II flippase
LLGLILVKVLAPGFYARQNIRTPVKIGIIALVATQAMNFAFMGFFQHAGLALAISLGACVNAAMLYFKLRQFKIYTPLPGWTLFALKIVLAIVAMSTCLWFAAGSDALWLHAGGLVKVTRLIGMVLLGSATYFAALWLLGFRPRDFIQRAA